MQAVGSPRPIGFSSLLMCGNSSTPRAHRHPELCSCCPHRVKEFAEHLLCSRFRSLPSCLTLTVVYAVSTTTIHPLYR